MPTHEYNHVHTASGIRTGFADIEAVGSIHGFFVSVQSKHSRRAVVMLFDLITHCRLYCHRLLTSD